MKFRLVYEGPLRTGKTDRLKRLQDLRRCFHPQLAELWQQAPLTGIHKNIDPEYRPNNCYIIESVGPFRFAPLITKKLKLIAELGVLFLRPGAPGSLIGHGGDIDNRIKTLLDALRMPKDSELIPNDLPHRNERPFFCLLQDDALVTHLSITTDRLLKATSQGHVMLVIDVHVVAAVPTTSNIGIA